MKIDKSMLAANKGQTRWISFLNNRQIVKTHYFLTTVILRDDQRIKRKCGMKSTPPGTRSVGNYIQIIIYNSIRLC